MNNNPYRNEYHFSVFKQNYIIDDNLRITRQFIVLKDGGIIIQFTDFHKYVGKLSRRIRRIESNEGVRLFYITKFLNYVFFQKYHVSRLTDITSDMVINFLHDYGLCTLPDDEPDTVRQKTTINGCVHDVLGFLEEVKKAGFKTNYSMNDFYTENQRLNTRTKRFITTKELSFEILYKTKEDPIFRDITNEAFYILLDIIITKHPQIMMLAALGAFAGLRPSEACNVRREEYGGIQFTKINNEIVDITIDLTEERNLRSDFKNVGGIKKERKQKVYPEFIPDFLEIYNTYMTYVSDKPFEKEFGALTNNSLGMAMTYPSYVYEFSKAVKDAIPVMLQSKNPETQLYGHMLMENSLKPHIFRHWFSMALVMDGVEQPVLMKYRGDKSPESSITYINAKSELIKQKQRVEDESFGYSLWKAGKMYGES